MSLQILLAEDNPGDILLVREALETHGVPYELHVVRDGEDALEMVTHLGETGHIPIPDIVLLDLNLPKVDGVELLTWFRKLPQNESTPVIIITSSDAPKDRARTAALGIAHYFKKPSDFDEFMELGAVVKRVVSQQEN